MEVILKDEMLQYFSQLNTEEQKSVVDLIKVFIKNRNELKSVTLEEYTKELEEADAEIASDYITHEEVKKRLIK